MLPLLIPMAATVNPRWFCFLSLTSCECTSVLLLLHFPTFLAFEVSFFSFAPLFLVFLIFSFFFFLIGSSFVGFNQEV